MPINVNSGLPGAIIGLLALLRNQGRQTGAPASEARASPPAQAAPLPQPPAAAPDSNNSAVRFDFAVAPAQAGPAAPASGETAPAPATPLAGSAAAPALPPVLAVSTPAAAGSLPAGTAASAAAANAGTAGAGQRDVPAVALPGSMRLPWPVAPDDEAMARAWALRSLARENTLGMIERIARMAEPPREARAVAENDNPGRPAPPAEPKTLARA